MPAARQRHVGLGLTARRGHVHLGVTARRIALVAGGGMLGVPYPHEPHLASAVGVTHDLKIAARAGVPDAPGIMRMLAVMPSIGDMDIVGTVLAVAGAGGLHDEADRGEQARAQDHVRDTSHDRSSTRKDWLTIIVNAQPPTSELTPIKK